MTASDASRFEALRRDAEAWLASDPDPGTRAELAAILARNDETEIVERFSSGLTFGTAGLRGVLGAGPNRMNRAVVIRTSAGLAAYLSSRVPDAARRGIVIGYDARRMSRTFAEDVAGVFAAAGIRVCWFGDIVPTPVLVFAVASLGAAGGVMITASHNPAAYNGYKVYGANGAQIVAPVDEIIASEIVAAPPAISVPRESLDAARAGGRLVSVADDVETRYVEGVRRLTLAPDIRPPLLVVYTPIHGVGYRVFERAMSAAGFHDVLGVREQLAPDPSFPTAPFPNPEEKGVLDLAMGLARQQDADLILANDPDADRLAVAVKNDVGEFVALTGNQIGVLLGYYLLTEDHRPGERAVVTTIVSSPMLREIARQLGVHCDETLTGFKWIASRAIELDDQGKRFVFGYEEALGYMVGHLVRDKDGIGAAVLFAELASVCKTRGTTVFDHLSSLYKRFGYFASSQRSVAAQGSEGLLRVANVMRQLRSSPPEWFAERSVLERRDHLARRRTWFDGQSQALTLPASDVLVYELEGESRVVLRPSGTEPKLKIYVDHRQVVIPGEPLAAARERGDQEVARIEQAVLSLVTGLGAGPW